MAEVLFSIVIFVIASIFNILMLYIFKKEKKALFGTSVLGGFLLAVVVLVLLVAMKPQICKKDSDEAFRFEVSPKRKQCMAVKGANYCPPPKYHQSCCGKGFNGKPIWFEYSSDAQKFQGQTCKSCKPLVKSPGSYWCNAGVY